jgi:hypothetical protein
MVFQKGRPRPPLRVKTCVICRKSFQPSSGAQKNCGETDCKAQAKALNLANRKAAKTRLDLKEEIDRVFSSGRLGADGDYLADRATDDLAAAHDVAASNGGSTHRTGEPTLELDLTPLESYVKKIVALSGTEAQPAAVSEELREAIREIVREEISARLKPLLGG